MNNFAKIKDLAPKSLVNNMTPIEIRKECGEKRRDRIWKECIKKAIILVTDYKNIRFKMVELALKACLIHRGGRVTANRYTIKNFAIAIGMPPKTLNEWIRIKTNIYDNLTIKDKKNITFTTLRTIDKQMVGEKRDKGFNKKLKSAIKNIKSKTATTIKMEKYRDHLKTIHFNCTNRSMIEDCDLELIGEIAHLCRGIVNGIKDLDRKK